MYYGSEADSKGNQMLELLKFEDGIISRQAFTFPGGDGCDFVFADTSLSEEETVLAQLREWCHIRLKHPVRNRILGPDFHSEQEASCLAEAIFAENASCKHKPFSLWVIPAGAAAVFFDCAAHIAAGRLAHQRRTKQCTYSARLSKHDRRIRGIAARQP